MKRFLWLLTAILCLTAVSCSPATVDEEAPNSDPADNDGSGLNDLPEAEPDIFPRSTLTPPPVGDPIEPESAPGSGDTGYPVPLLPSPTPLPEGYVVPTAPPIVNPYPEAAGNLIWVLKPVGEQCAETPTTPDLQTAVADMIAFGIPVAASEMTDLPCLRRLRLPHQCPFPPAN